MDVKLSLSLRDPTDDKQAQEKAKEAVKKAVAKRQQAVETIEEAWERILAMKNSETDGNRLREVREAMAMGVIGRHPSDASKRFSKAEALRLWAELNERKKAEKLAEMVRNTPPTYRLITTEQQLRNLVAVLRREPIIAVDTETTGVDVYADEIVGISLTLPTVDRHVYIPVAHDEGEQIPRDTVLNALRPILEDESIGKVLHNAKFDIHMFIRHGIRMRGLVWDTMVAMHLLNENEESFALKNLATKYLREPSDTFGELFGKAQFNTIPLDIALVYAAKDTDLTWRMYQFQRKHFDKLPQLLKIYEKIENPLIDICVDMEQTGFVLDLEHAKKLATELRTQIAEIEAELKTHFGDINFNSPVQLKPAIQRLVRQSIESTDVKTLKAIQHRHESIPLLLKYRELTKLLGTYVEALPQQVKADGRIHGQFNQAATVTGRFASSNPKNWGMYG